MAEFLSLQDGRRLCFQEFGAASGPPILYCHGFPGCRLEVELILPAVQSLGVRMIAADRPGMGRSSPQPGRTIGAWANDLAALADHLGLERFHLLGTSGGAPFAMAAAVALPERVIGLGLLCGLGSLGPRDSQSGMGWSQRAAIDFARAWPLLARTFYTGALVPAMIRFPDLLLSILVPQTAKADQQVLAEPEVRTWFRSMIREVFHQGGAAAAHELWLFTHRWEPDLRKIRVPTTIWHGDQDRTVPLAMGQRHAAAIPNARFRLFPGDGHFSLPLRHGNAVLQELLG